MNREESRKFFEEINGILERARRPKMMPEVLPVYERDSSMIPEKIRVSFDDGQTAVYQLRVEQPAPIIVENIKIIRKWNQGYVNTPTRRRGRK